MTAAVQYVDVLPLADLPDGERAFVEITGEAVVLIHHGGQLFAISDVCTHDDGPLGDGVVENCQIVCPRHGARFDLRSGKALTMPAFVDTTIYPLRVENGMIQIGINPES